MALPLVWLVLYSAGLRAATSRPEVTIDPGGVPPAVLQAITAAVQHIVSLTDDQDGGELERLRRRVRQVVLTALASEGYFAPEVALTVGEDVAGETWDIVIKPGERAIVRAVNLEFEGAIARPRFEGRVREARERWGLKEGQPFRNEAWDRAKRDLLAFVTEKDFAYGRIQQSQALIDPDKASASLTVRVASGPEVVLGPTHVSGLRRVPASLIYRYVRYEPGVTPYDRRQLIAWQQEMQSTVFFSSVDVVLDRRAQQGNVAIRPDSAAAGDAAASAAPVSAAEASSPASGRLPAGQSADAHLQANRTRDAGADATADGAQRETGSTDADDDAPRAENLRPGQFMAQDTVVVPLGITVKEAPARRVGAALGIDSDVGVKAEALYQQNVVAGHAVELRSGIGLNHKHQRGFLDLYMPPDPRGFRNKYGLLIEHSDIEGKDVDRVALGAIQTRTRQAAGNSRVEYETSFGAITSYERVRYGSEAYNLPSVVATFDWLRRDVDNKFDPREGYLVATGVGVGTSLDKVEPFARTQARGQIWWAVGERDLVTVRGEIGKVWARGDTRIPADFGFRVGGARTIRGYRYLGIGHKVEDAIIGARTMAVASVEYQHFFNDTLGMGIFIDAGDAAESFRDMRIAVGIGAGLRVRTPAGPIFFDLAYAERDRRLRLNFSLGIAF